MKFVFIVVGRKIISHRFEPFYFFFLIKNNKIIFSNQKKLKVIKKNLKKNLYFEL
jgi:hypothetical protein